MCLFVWNYFIVVRSIGLPFMLTEICTPTNVCAIVLFYLVTESSIKKSLFVLNLQINKSGSGSGYGSHCL